MKFISFLLRFVFSILLSLLLTIPILLFFKPIYTASSLTIPYAIYPFDICKASPVAWSYIKLSHCFTCFYVCMLFVNSIFKRFLKNKVVFVRADMNVSIKDGKIIDDTRIKATIPTIEYLVNNGAKVVLTSHLGSPKGVVNDSLSLKIVLERLKELMPKIKFNFSNDCIGEQTKKDIQNTNFGEVILLENLRFHEGEEANDENFAKELASLANIYVNDAFSTCHRKHASMVGVPTILPAYAGFTLEKELENLTNLVSNPEKPVMVIVGGSKVSTKLELLRALVKKYEYVVYS